MTEKEKQEFLSRIKFAPKPQPKKDPADFLRDMFGFKK
jgi:hypothetical protein